MGMGDYGEHCENCDHFDKKRSERHFCNLHEFVMPIASDNIICADWQLHGKNAPKNLTRNLADGILYIWNPYLYSPKVIDQFEAIQELLVDIDVCLVENSDCGILIYLSDYKDIIPESGETVSISVDHIPVIFQIRDIEVTVTHSSRNAEGKLDMEDRREVQRVALPENNVGKEVLLQWIDKHHNLAETRNKHARNLANPKILNQNKALRLFEKLVGSPKARSFSLNPGLGIP